jgi:5'-3' exonuclease
MLIVIDGNNTGNIHHHATTLTYGGFQTQAIFGFVKALRDFRARMPQAPILVLWDGRAQHRFDVDPEYKANRAEAEVKDPELASTRAAYRMVVPIIHKAIELLGIKQWIHPWMEADDLGGYLWRVTPGKTKVWMTGDTDWLQLVDETSAWVDARADGKGRIDLSNFHKATGYATPAEYIEGKMLIGDASDNIQGFDGIGKRTAPEFIAKWRTVQAFFDAVDTGTYTPATRKSKTAKSPHPEQVLASLEGRQRWAQLRQLMYLRDVQINPRDIRVTHSPCDPAKFRTLCDRLGFVSITRDYDNWVAPFHCTVQLPLPLAA